MPVDLMSTTIMTSDIVTTMTGSKSGVLKWKGITSAGSGPLFGCSSSSGVKRGVKHEAMGPQPFDEDGSHGGGGREYP